MTQDDMPAPAVVDEEKAVVEEESPLVEYVPPSPSRPEPKLAKPAPAKPSQPAPRGNAAADPFVVGVRVLKMAPAWLLFTAVCCSALILMLGWVRSSGEAGAATLPTKHNDARAAKPAPTAEEPRAQAEPPATASTAPASPQKSTAANDAPPQAVAQVEAPAAQAPQTPPPAAPKAVEKPRVETPAQGVDADGKFTAQVGSFNSQSEANERVSSLRAAGFEANVTAAELPGRGRWYRVQVGRFADRGEAAKTVAALRAKGAASSALVVPVQQ
jgi:cell division septation protein DedD